ncbi:oligogalacturonate lyase [Alicyclobacillus cellulosilyticus]|uniref:Oligogalacturonate lyase n=1 Tax=Alicyclobacillus cellulosilyticus TaxID=1003997 RepID=A0A917NH06_9BACL|nr:oligogalacturonate lyase family protein [Alicyclobacillus cellulosilyticus]GGJ00397.1 oligogalacturonate lyase [Alicyclobacillus cellulosilyticus]
MAKGSRFPAEWVSYTDPVTGVLVTQLTRWKAHNHHLYFTENGCYAEGQRLLFVSDRFNSVNLYSIDLRDGEIIQLTDLQSDADDLAVCLNPSGTKAYYRHRHQVISLDLVTLDETVLYELADNGFHIGQLSCSADGQYVYTTLTENLSHRFRVDLANGYVGHREMMEARPLSRIIRIPTAGGPADVVLEDNCWLGHVNLSPTNPELLTFCHEGPWNLVDHRIWGLNVRTGQTWMIRPRKQPHEMVGHEYWSTDGTFIGYHGFREDGTGFVGRIRPDNTEEEEIEFPFRNWHSHADDAFSRIVVDGRAPLTTLLIWYRCDDGRFSEPRVLCEHRCSFHVQKVHAHPRISSDGKRLVFTSDRNGYANVYVIELPEDVSVLPTHTA